MRTDLRSQTSSQLQLYGFLRKKMEMFKAELSEGECHQQICLSSAKLGYGAGHQLGEDITSETFSVSGHYTQAKGRREDMKDNVLLVTRKTACPLPNWAMGQAFKNYTRYDALNVVCELKAKVMKTACPLPNWARGQAFKNHT